MSKNNWSYEEHIVAYNLYCKIPFTKINSNYGPIKELASIIGRTSGSVAMKLANFARLDPFQKARNVSGLSQGAKGEEIVWNEFNNNWEELVYKSEQILARYKNDSLEYSSDIITSDLPPLGKDREALVKVRVNQSFFRRAVIASYNFKCCITNIAIPDLLIAGHIIPWSVESEHRTNPANGLCLNALHDKAFDKGLMTITPDYEIKYSEKLLREIDKTDYENFFYPYQNKKIRLPQKFHPLAEFLEYHNSKIFMQ
ncbi:putative restriction endonuclease [Chryseobacterium sp. H1D6B]|uniref:HNH endonuclease n=1 Tax=Chryseobacterium sp. H1D6B TaxID=2940588 RepID=UPI0015C71419|nr:HNH endonuclease [Chryseobacterium sp. H1D6B]MDH6253376.1 putative restriction endonuclease [Chryseobacterium sp. H1D6B]